MNSSIVTALLAVCAFVWAPPAHAQATQASASNPQDLKRLSIEELAQIDVTSVSRRPERLSETAAAVSVINSDEIFRSGLTSLAEVIRLADGVDVARVNSSTWATSLRGFNTNPANKLLVLMDGRSLYSPLTSGTFWDAQDTLLTDVDRVEVIRGPGGAVWGANAVNGVINVITKDAASTIGDYVSVAAGSDEHVYRFGASRRACWGGGATGSTASIASAVHKCLRQPGRAPATRCNWDRPDFAWIPASAGQPNGFWKGLRTVAPTVSPIVPTGISPAVTSWGDGRERFPERLRSRRRSITTAPTVRCRCSSPRQRHTVDVDLQQRLMLGRRHNLVFGGGARVSRGRDVGTAGFFFEPQSRTNSLFSLMAQDEIALKPNRLYLTLGSKFERNDFTGFEMQPTIRVRWTPDDASDSLGRRLARSASADAARHGSSSDRSRDSSSDPDRIRGLRRRRSCGVRSGISRPAVLTPVARRGRFLEPLRQAAQHRAHVYAAPAHRPRQHVERPNPRGRDCWHAPAGYRGARAWLLRLPPQRTFVRSRQPRRLSRCCGRQRSFASAVVEVFRRSSTVS